MSKPVINTHDPAHGSLRGYVVGFVLSLGLTLAAYFLVRHGSLSSGVLIVLVVFLALAQFAVQLFFFLHLGEESRPRLRLWAVLFMLLVVGILVFGSLWIMNNLSYNMMHMSPQETNKYLHNHEGL